MNNSEALRVAVIVVRLKIAQLSLVSKMPEE